VGVDAWSLPSPHIDVGACAAIVVGVGVVDVEEHALGGSGGGDAHAG